ncbi:hypothetical protein OAT72_04890 [Alphaproteobacteria bacterium]|nr:hypothetical protein [Alphaproteobacteria bacterium]
MAPAISHNTTSGNCAPNNGILKNTTAPTQTAIGAVMLLMVSSIPARAGVVINSTGNMSSKNLIIEKLL